MKAVVLTGHGGPERHDYRENVLAPEPAEGRERVGRVRLKIGSERDEDYAEYATNPAR